MVSGSAGCWSAVHRAFGPSSGQFLWGPREAQNWIQCHMKQDKAAEQHGGGLEPGFSSQARILTDCGVNNSTANSWDPAMKGH